MYCARFGNDDVVVAKYLSAARCFQYTYVWCGVTTQDMVAGLKTNGVRTLMASGAKMRPLASVTP